MEPIKVASLAQIREAVDDVTCDVDLAFLVSKRTSLAEAHEIFDHLSMEGGHGTVVNLDQVVHKVDALNFVERKLTRLRRWKSYVQRKLLKLDQKVGVLQAVVDHGGPGARPDHRPRCYKGQCPFVDTEQVIDDEDMPRHVALMRSIVLEASPGSPAPQGYGSAEASSAREEAEQLDIARFNLCYLKVKREAMALLNAHLEQGIMNLEASFVQRPTCLGAESADFIRFEEVVTHAGEVVHSVGPSDS